MIWLQLITAAFAVACAWLNRWPVNLMRKYGMPDKESEREFHTANAAVKVLWMGALSWYLKVPILVPIILLLILWLVFDPALNLFTGKPLFYLGKTALLDRIVVNGKIKAIVVLILIIALNLFAL